jgi:hypothetical protein
MAFIGSLTPEIATANGNGSGVPIAAAVLASKCHEPSRGFSRRFSVVETVNCLFL